MIIDAHNHPDWLGHDVTRVLEDMTANGIDKTWMLSWEAPVDEYNPTFNASCFAPEIDGPVPFSRCLAYVSHAPDKFVLGYAPDPRRPEAIDLLQAAIDIHGVRVYGELKLRAMYDNPDFLRMFRFCGQKGLPVVVHLDYEFDSGNTYPRPDWWYGGGIDAFERVIAQCPETVFLGHAPGFWAHISGDDQYDKEVYPKGEVVPGGKVVELMRKYENLYCDMSAGSAHNALTRDTEFTIAFLTEFQDRVLYARDCFTNIHQELFNALDLPRMVLDKIYSGNALKLVPPL